MDKRNILAAAFAALGTLTMHAQGLKAEQESIDLGRVAYKTPVTASFKIVNKGKNELRINDVRTNCGCVVAELKHRKIGKGKSITLSATYDAKQLGHFEKVIAVYADELQEPYMVRMKGVVVADVDEFDGIYDYKLGELDVDHTSIEFDDVNRGDRPTQKIHIKNNSGHDVEPVIMHLPPYLSATVSPTKIAPGHAGTATIILDSRGMHDLGLTQTTVYLGSYPGDKVSEDKSIEISTVLLPEEQEMAGGIGNNAPALRASTSALELGSFGKRKKKSGSVTLKNEGGDTLEIRSIQVFTPGLDVSLGNRKILPGKTETIKVTAHKELLQKARTQPRILMITNDPVQPKVVIYVNIK